MAKLGKMLPAISASAVMLVGLAPNAHAEGMKVPTIEASEVMSGLENPWDMSFLSDGTMFYTEKCKGLSVRTASGDVNALYGVKGSSGYGDSGSDLFCDGQAGMLGVVADSDFDSNGLYWISVTISVRSETLLRSSLTLNFITMLPSHFSKLVLQPSP